MQRGNCCLFSTIADHRFQARSIRVWMGVRLFPAGFFFRKYRGRFLTKRETVYLSRNMINRQKGAAAVPDGDNYASPYQHPL
jgi:hypothetical protein